MTMTAAMKKKQEQHETAVVEMLSHAQRLAEVVFGSQVNVYAVEEIYDYLQDGGVDEQTFSADLAKAVTYTKTIYKTVSPTPEQVFGVFERVFLAE